MRSLIAVAVLLVAVCDAQSWTTQAKDIETIIIGISFINQTHGWVPGDQNGVGARFLRTTDGGKTWTVVPHDGYVTLPMGIAMQRRSDGSCGGVISGIGIGRNFSSMEYSPDGSVFHPPPNYTNLFGESQDAKNVMGVQDSYALAGQYEDAKGKSYNGATVTTDGGKTWINYDIGAPDPFSRYGSYPSPTTWYLALGDFPSSSIYRDPDMKVWTQKLSINKRTNKMVISNYAERAMGRELLQTAGYSAAISKTSDGGKTWTTVFNDTGNFYFNDIDCPTTTDCWVVGESESDSPQPGIRILHTANGGANWDVQLYINNPDYSLMDIAMVNATEGWAVGGIFSRGITGLFYHTTDGGKTWVNAQSLNDEYATSLSFYQPTAGGAYYGWASALTREGASSILVYS